MVCWESRDIWRPEYNSAEHRDRRGKTGTNGIQI